MDPPLIVSITYSDKLAVVLTAVAAGLAAWAIGNLAYDRVQNWRNHMLDEAELELEEMLLQIPTEQLINAFTFVGTGLSAVVFVLVTFAGDGLHWKAGIVLGMLMFFVTLMIPRVAIGFLKKRRLQRFNEQLEEALLSMSNSLKAGFSIIQAIETVVRQNRQPISIEFKLMMQQTHLGMSMDEALQNMARRVNSSDFYLVSTAICTARVTGGDLTGIFDRLAAMIRERMRIERRIQSLTAQGRLQGIVLGLLPMLLLFVLFLMAPDTVIHFFSQPIGIALFLLTVTLEICGYYIIRRIVNIDI
jgi:tight adherence protein B